EKRSNLHRNHQRYINFLGNTAGFLPMVSLPTDILARLEALRLRFPNFSDAIDFYLEQFALAQLAEDAVFSANPLLLSGPAGVGKTAFCHELAKAVEAPFQLIGLSSTTAGFVLGGMSSGWSEGKPGKVVEVLARERRGNPLIVVDELDKVAADKRYDPLGSLYQLLESETAKDFIDEGLEIGTNCAHIVWVGTTNNLTKIPAPILSRFSVIEVASPTVEQMRHVVASIYRKVRETHPWGTRFSTQLPEPVVSKVLESGLAPRLVQKELIAACGKAVLRETGRQTGLVKAGYEVAPDDFNPRGVARPKSKAVVQRENFDANPLRDDLVEPLVDWSVREVHYKDAIAPAHHYLLGCLPKQGAVNVTAAIQAFDRETRCVKTANGVIYQLVGQPGFDDLVEVVWEQWKNANAVINDVDVTHQYCWTH
ncbi:hypothetical protein A1342_21870, partial [Methylomonas methanica]